MIQLVRKDAPDELTAQFVQEKTELFKKTKESVWNVDWLKDKLKELSNGKCAYCECALDKESNYMEVEHFKDKSDYPDSVLKWDNLLPSCKHCNGHKSNHDVVKEPIVNPFEDNPNDHLYFQLYRYKAKDAKGQCTIEVLDLNDPERKLVDVRFNLGNQIQDSLKDFLEKFDVYLKQPSVRMKNSLVRRLIATMQLCLPESEYSAACATVLHQCDEYQQLKEGMKANGIWTDTLEDCDIKSRAICLFK